MPFQKGNQLWKRWKAPPFLGKNHSVETRSKIARNGKHQFEKGNKTLGFTGHHHTIESRRKTSQALSGERNPFYGKHHSLDFRRRQSEIMAQRSKQLWRDPEWRQRTIAASFAGRSRKPNKLEKKLIELITEASLPFKYTGDGSVIIHGFVPDFIECNGQKLIIELFGDYWHTKADMRKKAGAYNHYGYNTLFIWEHELKEDGEAIIRKIKAWEVAHAS